MTGLAESGRQHETLVPGGRSDLIHGEHPSKALGKARDVTG